eukprot:TRINITY_DN32861_c0_g1_i1.p1 TRINITY_DN32861_c0_g1~~TRINITY_DN32861_c0_g1_i1.p1  ORF type:complete len:758 (+),score=146.02 TRINITY_DN32861_c0_g1_i1:203-2476(+)
MIDYNPSLLYGLVFQRTGSVFPRAFAYALPSWLMAVGVLMVAERFPDLFQVIGVDNVSNSQPWAITTTVLFSLVGFRIRQAMNRFWEGTGLLHQMRGEWYDSVSCLMTFSRGSKETRREEVEDFRHTLIRLMSLCHGSALEEVQGRETQISFDVLDITGLDLETLQFLNLCRTEYHFNRVEVLLHMIQILTTEALHDGVLTIPPPILSRVYQTLSRGLVNLLNAKKITDTMFPFPFAQVIALLLLLQNLFMPLLLGPFLLSKQVTGFVCFVSMFGMVGLNLIASELEQPFGEDENDLPLRHFQTEMNRSLLMFVHDMSDHRPYKSEICVTEFEDLVEAVNEQALRERDHASCRGVTLSRAMTSAWSENSPAGGQRRGGDTGRKDSRASGPNRHSVVSNSDLSWVNNLEGSLGERTDSKRSHDMSTEATNGDPLRAQRILSDTSSGGATSSKDPGDRGGDVNKRNSVEEKQPERAPARKVSFCSAMLNGGGLGGGRRASFTALLPGMNDPNASKGKGVKSVDEAIERALNASAKKKKRESFCASAAPPQKDLSSSQPKTPPPASGRASASSTPTPPAPDLHPPMQPSCCSTTEIAPPLLAQPAPTRGLLVPGAQAEDPIVTPFGSEIPGMYSGVKHVISVSESEDSSDESSESDDEEPAAQLLERLESVEGIGDGKLDLQEALAKRLSELPGDLDLRKHEDSDDEGSDTSDSNIKEMTSGDCVEAVQTLHTPEVPDVPPIAVQAVRVPLSELSPGAPT